MSIQNLAATYDPFADTGDDPVATSKPTADVADDDVKVKAPQDRYIHIRIQQRNGRKTLTTLQGLPKQYDPKKLIKAFKKEFACNGTVVDDEDAGQVIQLQGDQRQKIGSFLSDEVGIPKQEIKIHGF